MSRAFDRVYVDCYGRLLRLAYVMLPLPPGGRRLLRARKIVRRSAWLSGRGDPYAVLRRRVMRRVMVASRQRLDRPSADGGDLARLWRALADLSPASRAAYVLRRLEDLDDKAVREQLEQLGVRDLRSTDRVLAEIDSIGLSSDEQRALLTSPESDPARPLIGDARPPRRRLVALTVGLVVIVAAAGGWSALHDDDGGHRLVTRTHPGLGGGINAWPTRGDRREDRGLLRRARDAWLHPGDHAEDRWSVFAGAHPAGTITVLYAGTVDDEATVVMHDEDEDFALYTDTGAGALRTDRYLLTSRDLTPGPIRLSDTEDPTVISYLLPPDVSEAQVSRLGASAPDWEPGRTHDGVITVPVAKDAKGYHCATTVFRLQRADADRQRFIDLHDVISARLAFTGYGRDAKAAEGDVLDDPQGLMALRGAMCRPPVSDDLSTNRDVSVFALSVSEFWRGELPETGHPASFLRLAAELNTSGVPYPAPGTLTETLLVDRSPTHPDRAHLIDAAFPVSHGQASVNTSDSASSTWWLAPSGRWYLIIGGNTNVAHIRVHGDMTGRASRPTLILKAPSKTTDTHLPHIAIETTDRHGHPN
jgi:hypothetical protein